MKAITPSISCAKLEAADGILTVTVTNMDQRISAKVDCTVEQPGATLIPFVRIDALVDKMSGEVEIMTDEKNISFISSGKNDVKLYGLSVDEFPPQPENKTAICSFTEENGIVSSAIRKVITAASVEEYRQILCGVHVKGGDSQITFAASDGRRAHICKTALTGKVDFVIPTASAKSLADLFDEGEFTINVYDNVIVAESKEASFMTKLIEGNFPDMSPLIPPTADAMKFHKSELLEAISFVSPLIDKLGSLKIASTKKGVILSSSTAETGEAECRLDGKQKVVATIALNAQFLTDAVKSLNCEEVLIETEDPSKPIAIHDGDFTAVIMLIRNSQTINAGK
jgi:DNA polymerase III beta subunit